MDLESYRNYCLSLPGTTEKMPFDEETLVFYVGGKMFSLTDINRFHMIILKCDPDKALDLREAYDFVRPGYHMNKKHWNSIILDQPVSGALIKEWTLHSYQLVYNQLPKKIRSEISGSA